jgi:hypothetical protein
MITKAGYSRCHPSGSWLRLLLLVILALGVWQMHGSGHITGQPGTGHQAAGAEHAANPMASGPANATDPGEPPVPPLPRRLALQSVLRI